MLCELCQQRESKAHLRLPRDVTDRLHGSTRIGSETSGYATRVLRAIRALVAFVLAVPAVARAEPELRMPPGTRTDGQGQLISGRGLRESSDFLAKELARRGISAQQIGPYSVRGVELTRFVSQTPSTPWLAVHVLRTGGKTLIFLVPRPKAAATP